MIFTAIYPTGFTAYWIYCHLGRLKDMIQATWTLIKELWQCLLDPVALMKAFRFWCQSVYLFRPVEHTRLHVQTMLLIIQDTNFYSIVRILLGTVVLALFTLAVYAIYQAPYAKFLVFCGMSPDLVSVLSKKTWLDIVRLGWKACWAPAPRLAAENEEDWEDEDVPVAVRPPPPKYVPEEVKKPTAQTRMTRSTSQTGLNNTK